MINSDQARKSSQRALDRSNIDSPRMDDEVRIKLAGIVSGFEKRARLDSEQVELLALQAKRRDPVTLSNPRLDEDQQVGKGSGAMR